MNVDPRLCGKCRESDFLRELSCPHIVKCYDVIEDSQQRARPSPTARSTSCLRCKSGLSSRGVRAKGTTPRGR